MFFFLIVIVVMVVVSSYVSSNICFYVSIFHDIISRSRMYKVIACCVHSRLYILVSYSNLDLKYTFDTLYRTRSIVCLVHIGLICPLVGMAFFRLYNLVCNVLCSSLMFDFIINCIMFVAMSTDGVVAVLNKYDL